MSPPGGMGAAADSPPVLNTAELERQPVRQPDHEAANRALASLATVLAREPEQLLERLTESLLELCDAGSVGVSVLVESEEDPVFHWTAVAGRLAHARGGIIPARPTPCATAMDLASSQLFSLPDRQFECLRGADPRIVEALVVPFDLDGRPAGTIWVVAHDEQRRFDREDERLARQFAPLAAAAVRSIRTAEDRDEAMLALARRTVEAERVSERLQREVSERIRAENELREADQRKNEFLAMLGHELRNPLAAMLNSVRLVRTPARPQSHEKAIGVIERQAHHLKRMVDDLLDLSRITQGRLELRRVRMALTDLVDEAIESCAPLVEERHHHFTCAPIPADVWIEADPTRVVQILCNLLSNAARYTPAGGTISLSALAENDHAVLTVRDDGRGIDPGSIDRIFELFAQEDAPGARSREGMGIGLSMVRNLAELHGGTISATSAGRDQGSEFTLRLPLCDPPQQVARATGAETDAAGAAAGSRVLVVDDNVDAAESLAELLTLWGQEVRVAHRGGEALELASGFQPHVVILDIGLPGMGGYEIARRMRENNPGVEVRMIALTGYGREEDRQRSREAGFDLHLIKPIDPARLRSLIAPPG